MRNIRTVITDKENELARRHTREPLRPDNAAFSAARPPLLSSASGRFRIGFVGLSAGAGATTLAFAAAEYLAALAEKPKPGSKLFARGEKEPGASAPIVRGEKEPGGSKIFARAEKPQGRSNPFALGEKGPGVPTPSRRLPHPGARPGVSTVTLLELDPGADAPAGRPYDKIGIDRRFAGRCFESFYRHATLGKPLSGILNIDGGICWALRIPGEPLPAIPAASLLRLLNNVTGDVIICDIPAHRFLYSADNGMDRDALLSLLADLDHIVCIFDPLPSRLLAAVPAAELCRAAAAAGVPATYVFNKLNPGVNKREATRFTGVRDYLPFPAVPAEAVYAAEYACRSLASEPEIHAALKTLFG